MSCNHKHLIDSHDLFCCIAAVVALWPSLWKGGRTRKKRAREKKHGSLNLILTPRIKAHHSSTLLSKLDWSGFLILKKYKCCDDPGDVFFYHLLLWLHCKRVFFSPHLSTLISFYLSWSPISPIHNLYIAHIISSVALISPIFPGITFHWTNQSNLLPSVPTQTSISKTSIFCCGRCCLLLDDFDRLADPLFFSFNDKSAHQCEAADWGGVILGQSIDNPSCRGQSAILMTKKILLGIMWRDRKTWNSEFRWEAEPSC